MTTARAKPPERVSIDDIRGSLRALAAPIDAGVAQKRDRARVAGVVAVAAVVVVAYWLGRRAGRRRQTILEIRRI
jgi:hypothetical protein